MLQQNTLSEGVRTKRENERKEGEKVSGVPGTSSSTACQASKLLSWRVQLHKPEVLTSTTHSKGL